MLYTAGLAHWQANALAQIQAVRAEHDPQNDRLALRLDRPFVPHLTLARLADAGAVQRLCERWNAERLVLHARVSELTVGRLHGGRFTARAACALGGA